MDFPLFRLPAPLDGMAIRTMLTIQRLLPQNAALSQARALGPRSSVCALSGLSPSGPTCSIEGCSWAANFLQMLLLPSYARASNREDEDPVMSFMEELIVSEERRNMASNGATPQKTVNGPADRIVAIGDVHGDVTAMRVALRNASIIDERDNWIGGRSVLVQVGDQLDRGQDERSIYRLLFRLQDRAPAAGGAVHILLGNHELMNTRLDFRYVTRGGFEDFSRSGPDGNSEDKDHLSIYKTKNEKGRKWRPRVAASDLRMIRSLPPSMQARARAIVAGGPLASELGRRARIGVVVGDTLFVHGGLSLRHLRFGGRDERDAEKTLDDINNDTRKFLMGDGEYPAILHGSSSPVWMRDYSRPGVRPGGPECKMLADTLRLFGAKRMVVGHTPQAEGINSACGGKVWRIDTGMSKVYGGVPEAIEISRRGNIRILTSTGKIHGSARFK